VEHRLRGNRTEPRIVVLIDDLDRCPDDKIMEVLQAINLILGESSFYVVLGIDTAMIYRAIESHYGGDDRPLPPRFAETYLQKIVQLPFHLPETNPAERGSFVARLFSDAARDGMSAGEVESEPVEYPDGPGPRDGELKWDRQALAEPHVRVREQLVEDTATELRAFVDYQAYLADNPRELKRLVNVHRFVKIVLQQEGRPPSPELQRKLVKWLVFCARWPDLVDDVLAQARDHPAQQDCLGLAVSGIAGAQEFAALDGTGDLLTPVDLAPEGTLAKAASISHLIVWDTAVKPPAVPAAAEP
jgi:KAP-like P-loop domain-containing protein